MMNLLHVVSVIALNFGIIVHCRDDVRLPPSILKSPPNTVVYRSDQTIELPCSASGIPQPAYEWRKNGRPLNLNTQNIRLLTDGGIELTDTGPFDEGYYQCFASNQFGSACSGMTVLRRAFQQDPPVAVVSDVTVKEGEPFHIEIMELKSFPTPQFRWASTDKVGSTDSTSTDLVRTKRMQWAENGNLYFSYALPEDHLGGKIYKGLIFNPSVDISAGGSYTRVTVESVRGAIKHFPPSISFSSPNQTVALEGDDISLRCFFSGYPDPEIRWTGPKNILPVGRFTLEKFNTELRITNLKQSDEGEYICSGSNSKGTTAQKIKLTVQAIPVFNKFYQGPRNSNVTEGESVTFQCNPYAKPKAKVTWFINGNPLDVVRLPSRVSISPVDRSLTVRSVCRDCSDRESFSDLMVIQCNASNDYGYAFGAGYLNVLKKTTVTLASDREVNVEDQQSVTFQCFPFSDPSTPVRILWYRVFDGDQQMVVYPEPPVVVVGNGMLMITAGDNASEWVKHRGEYKCVADNGYSRDEAMVKILFNTDTKGPPAASILDLWWIFVIIACLFLIFILILICCICIFRNRGDKYDVDGKERKNGNDPEKELIASGFRDYQRGEVEPFKGSQNSLGSSARLFGDDNASEVGDHRKFIENGSYYTNTTDRKKGRSEYI